MRDSTDYLKILIMVAVIVAILCALVLLPILFLYSIGAIMEKDIPITLSTWFSAAFIILLLTARANV